MSWRVERSHVQDFALKINMKQSNADRLEKCMYTFRGIDESVFKFQPIIYNRTKLLIFHYNNCNRVFRFNKSGEILTYI